MGKNQELNSARQKEMREIVGGCHCQAIRFRARVTVDTVVLNCNCSICSMTGFQHLIVKHHDFELLSGEEHLTKYQFNTGQAEHLFCDRCGVKSFYQPRSHPDCWSINTHCVDRFNPDEWTINDFDGQNWEQAKQEL